MATKRTESGMGANHIANASGDPNYVVVDVDQLESGDQIIYDSNKGLVPADAIEDGAGSGLVADQLPSSF